MSINQAWQEMDATGQAELVASGEASPSELVEAAIGAVEALNPEINAVIHRTYESARAQAASPQLPDGPFKGVPFVLKDLGAGFAGEPMHLGMQVLKDADFRLPLDTYLAERFRAAGLISIGKTNVPEMGILPTTEPRAYGATKNPWDHTRTPGGSSGGSAAAVACGMVAIAHANDGGGSIRIPASNNGLVGLKTTRARTSEGPFIGDNMAGMTTELVLSKSVRDTATILDAVHGPAPGDPYVAPAPTRPYAAELDDESSGLGFALWSDPAIEVTVDPQCVAAAEATAALLEGLGHHRVEGSPLGAIGLGDEIDLRDSFLTRWAAGQAAALGQFGVLVGRELTADDVEPLTWALAEIGRARDSGRLLADIALHHGLTRMVAAWFGAGNDLLITPTMAEIAPKLGSFDDSGGDPMAAFERALPCGAFTALWNVTGNPAISLPLAVSEEGVPIGVQIIAAYGREDLLLRVAAQLERSAGWRLPPPSSG